MSVSKKQIQYASQTGPYKVFVKDKGAWQMHDTARLQISVGNPKHDGNKFFALAEWASARFDHVILIISDTLQRHNIAFHGNYDQERAYEISLAQGDYWLYQNKEALDVLPNKTVTRWNDWLNHPEFKASHDVLKSLYENREDVRNAINKKAEDFSKRHMGSLAKEFSSERLMKTSVSYILEEVAAFSLMFRTIKAIDIYPGEWFRDIFDVLKKVESEALLSSFQSAECLRVDFVRNSLNPNMTNRQVA